MTRNNIKYSKLEENGVEYMGPVEHIPTAQDILFSNTGYDSDNVKDAIIEGTNTAIGVAGFAILAYTGSNAGVGKYLDIIPGTSSDMLPYPITTDVVITSAGIRTPSTSTVTVTIYKLVTGVETFVMSLVLSNAKSNNYNGLYISIAQGQDLVFKVTSGSAKRPGISLTVRKAE